MLEQRKKWFVFLALLILAATFRIFVVHRWPNDAPEDAREVARRLAGIRCKVNLIAFNPGPGVSYSMPVHERVLEFQSILASVGVTAVELPPQSPNLNAYAERFVRSIKEACLDRLILFGEVGANKQAN